MEMRRAWATLEIKSVDGPGRKFTGIASTPSVDHGGDSMDPMGAEFQLPMPLLWQHGKGDIADPIGAITKAVPSKDGIFVEGYFAEIPEPASLKDQLDRVYALVKNKLVRGLSIGWSPKEFVTIKGSNAVRWVKWGWHELSAVAIPMNSEATILNVKEMDLQSLAASGDMAKATESKATTVPASRATSKAIKMSAVNVKEQIAAFEAKRAANAAAMDAIMAKTVEETRSTSTEEAAEFDALQAENDRIDADLVRWRKMDKSQAVADRATAVEIPASAGTDEAQSLKLRAGDGVLRPNAALPPGIGMARYVKAFAFAKGNYSQAMEYAKQWDTSTPEVGLALKTAISAGTTTDSVWAGPLVYAQDFPAAFLDYLRPQTIIGKITGMTQVPFNIRYGIQDGASTVAWVGQGAPKPVSKLTFTSGSLGFAKAAGIVVITQELARFSSPSAELKVRNDLTKQMIQFLDQQFIDPSVAAVSNVSPASVLNGASNVRQAAAAWTSMANVLTDVKAFLATFAANEISLTGAYWIMTPDTALSLSLLLTTGGNDFAFPTLSVNGGTWLGLPVIVSNGVPHSTSAGAIVALVVPEHIYMADDGAIAIDTSVEASLQMDTAPTNNSATPTATSLVSMFQTNSIAIRVERVINWARARAYGAGYIDNMHTS
jgi:HK97 family phage major capsid protein